VPDHGRRWPQQWERWDYPIQVQRAEPRAKHFLCATWTAHSIEAGGVRRLCRGVRVLHDSAGAHSMAGHVAHILLVGDICKTPLGWLLTLGVSSQWLSHTWESLAWLCVGRVVAFYSILLRVEMTVDSLIQSARHARDTAVLLCAEGGSMVDGR